MATFEGHTKAVFDVAFGRRGQWLASSSWDGMVRVWETATGKTRLTLAGHIDSVYGVAFSPDDKRVAAASEDKVVFVWDTRTSLPILGLRHEVSVRDVAFSSDNTRIATVTWDAGSRVWDAETGECLEQLDERYEVEGLAGGKAAQFRVALGHRETTIRRASSGEEAGWFPGSLTELAAHPCRWMWAGYLGKNFVLFTLNGVLPDERPT